MLAISLMRMGAKKKPFYRIVVKEKRSKRDGKYLENVGTYNPMANPAEVEFENTTVFSIGFRSARSRRKPWRA
jgi:small subunit ribosomal protein S16